jgi:hypothetical protein
MLCDEAADLSESTISFSGEMGAVSLDRDAAVHLYRIA